MIAAQLDENNIVINRIIVDSLGVLPNLVNGENAVIGAQYDPQTGEFTPPQPQTIVPAEVTRRQAVLALYDAGMLPTVKSWVTSIGGELEIYWDTSPVFRRNHAFVEAARVELGLTHQQMDGLFISADTKER